MEVHPLCRLCLTHSSYHSNIFVDKVSDKQLHHLINCICELNAFRNDGLPEYICVDCFQNITRTFSFINQAKEATSALKLMVDRNKSLGSLFVETSDLRNPDTDEKPGKKSVTKENPFGTYLQNSPVVEVEIPPEESQRENDEGTEEDDVQFLSEVSGMAHMLASYVQEGDVQDSSKQSKGDTLQPSGKEKSIDEPFSSAAGNLRIRKESQQRRVASPFVCQLCGVGYTRKDHLKRHQVAKHDLRFLCTICGIELGTKLRLKRHLEAHRGLRPYTCHVCQFRFKDRAHLRKHRQKGCVGSKLRASETS